MNDQLAFSPEGLSKASSIGITNIFAAIKTGKLKSRKFGRKRLILRDDAMAWLKALPES